MPTDILAYIGAAAMVVLAFLAYRYWRSTAAYAHRVRETHARHVRDSYRASSVLASVAPGVEPLPEGKAGGVVALGVDEGSVEEALEEVEGPSAESDDETSDDLGDLAPEPSAEAIESEPDLTDPDVQAPEDLDLAELTLGHAPDQSESESDVSDLDGESPEDAGDLSMEEPPDEAGSAPEIVGTAQDAPESVGGPVGVEASDEVEPEPEIAPRDEILEDPLAESETTPPETQEVPEGTDGATVEGVDKSTPEFDEDPAEAEGIGPERTDTGRTDAFEPSIRLIEDLEPSRVSTPTANGSLNQLLKELDQQLEALPIGIELMELPLLERRRVADRREDLIRDRARLLEQRKGGAHRRRRKGSTT